MSAAPTGGLLCDPLDGKSPLLGSWRHAPSNFVQMPDASYALRCSRGTTWNSAGLAWAGDESWSSYRIEVEILPEKMWTEIDFHVQADGQSGCAITFFPESDKSLFLELMGLWGEAGAFKLYPSGQRSADRKSERWTRVRIDVGPTVANVTVNDEPQPSATFRDLPFSKGGVRLGAYAGSALFRNLSITALQPGDVQPILADPWAAARKSRVLRDWKLSPAFASGAFPDGLPETEIRNAASWGLAPIDDRGVVHLTGHFQPNNRSATAFALCAVQSEKAGPARLTLTYTDNFKLWCNGEAVFTGPPRQWFHPDREKYGYSRLIPSQFEVTVPLRAGNNVLLVRTETVEPFGWGFWINMPDYPQDPIVAAKNLFKAGQYIEARTSFELLAKEQPRNSEAVFYLGWIAFRLNQPEQSVTLLEQAVALDAKQSLYFHVLGDAYGGLIQSASIFKKLGLAKKCIAAYDRGVALNPSNVEVRTARYRFYLKAPAIVGGSADKAEAELAEIRKLNPEHAAKLLAKKKK